MSWLRTSALRSGQRNHKPRRGVRRNSSRLLVGLGLVLVIGGLGASAAPAHRLAITLQIAEPTGFEPQWRIMAANFERVNPNIQVNVSFPGTSSTLPGLINTELAAGNAPDLWMARPGPGQAASVVGYAKAGQVADLSGRPWNKRLYPAVADDVKYNGKVYGWPMELIIQGAFYDVDVFKRLGLTPPTKFADVLSFCQKVAAKGLTPIALSLNGSQSGVVLAMQMADQNVYGVDSAWTKQRLSGAKSFAGSPGWRVALQQIVDMKNANCFQGTAPVALSLNQQIAMFASGKAVVALAVASHEADIKLLDPKANLGYFVIPPVNPKTMVVPVTMNNVLVVNAASKNLDAAKSFVDFVAREEQSRTYAKAAGSIAPFDAVRAKIPDYVPYGVKQVLGPLFLKGRVVSQPSADFPSPSISDVLGSDVQGLFTGQKSVDDVLKDLDYAWSTSG